MEVLKRILGITAIIISVILIVICLAGVVISWSINAPITNAVTGVLSGVEHVLTAADKSLERVNNGLFEAQTSIDTIEENVKLAGETLSENSIVYQLLDRTVGDELFPKIAAASDTIMAIRDSLIAFNEILESLNEMPFVSVPTLTEELDNAAESMATMQSDVEQTRAELKEIKEEAISKPVTAITDRTTRISNELKAAQLNLSNTQDNLRENIETIASIKSRVSLLIDLTSAVLSFVFLWLAFGQVVLIMLAWRSVKAQDEPGKAEDVVSNDDELESQE